MLVIDDNMFKLAKMQESLLRATDTNREENLNNYKKTVAQIDGQAFADILEELKHIDEHNQSLEDEVQFLERIKSCYNQLLELQLSFRKVCELYGGEDLKLSDLTQLNIEYIDNRINTINGYLINLRNISENKDKIQQLSEQLVVEEKKRNLFASRLLELEEVLRRNFKNAEGRYLVDGQLQYCSVVSEYKKLDLDFEQLLTDIESLDDLLLLAEKERAEANEKLNTAQLCYDNAPTTESKQILDEIRKDSLKYKYRLTMLKILKLLSQDCDDYDSFREKREQILDLIKYRLACIESLGIRISIDPFARTKVNEQLDSVISMSDNSKTINRIRKEIGQLTARTEEMVSQNSDYLISLSDTKTLLQSSVGMSDIDISMIDVPLEESVLDEVKVVENNQVVRVRSIADALNMSIVGQKTASVIKRVNQMINGSVAVREPETLDEVVTDDPVVPELVIVPKAVQKKPTLETEVEEPVEESAPTLTVVDTSPAFDTVDNPFDFVPDLSMAVSASEDEKAEETTLVDTGEKVDFSNLFETVVPFTEPEMFADRSEESLVSENSLSAAELEQLTNKPEEDLQLQYNNEDEMPEAFWTTEEESNELTDDNILSFEDQINALLSSEKGEDVKTRKLVA